MSPANQSLVTSVQPRPYHLFYYTGFVNTFTENGRTFYPYPPYPPLRDPSFHRKEGASTRAPSLGRGCRAQRGGVGSRSGMKRNVRQRFSRIVPPFPRKGGRGIGRRMTQQSVSSFEANYVCLTTLSVLHLP